MRRRAPEELRAEPVGHRRRRGPGRDGAVAHGPQAGVLAEGQTETLRPPETRREAPDGARGPRPGDPPSPDWRPGRGRPRRPFALPGAQSHCPLQQRETEIADGTARRACRAPALRPVVWGSGSGTLRGPGGHAQAVFIGPAALLGLLPWTQHPPGQ